MLAVPKIVVLDSSTLGTVSRDYWSSEVLLRDKSREFLKRLVDHGIHIALTLTHVSELLRHENQGIQKDRLLFLRGIKLIAWLRPYDRTWFPGGISDLFARELHAVIHHSCRSWQEIVRKVRPELWETGVGADMFVENEQLWSAVHSESRSLVSHEKMVASIARTDAGQISTLKLCDSLQLPRRPKEERRQYLRRFQTELKRQLDRHGDKKLTGADAIAADFAMSTLLELESIDALGGDPAECIPQYHGVPQEWVQPEMTIGELGELVVYVKRFKFAIGKLNPAINIIRMADFPPTRLPSYVIERALAALQVKEDRVAGSDLGDSHLAPLALYSDGVQVDKRTLHHLTRIKRRMSELTALMGQVFRSPNYENIPDSFEAQSNTY